MPTLAQAAAKPKGHLNAPSTEESARDISKSKPEGQASSLMQGVHMVEGKNIQPVAITLDACTSTVGRHL